jgi:hypothetical protein
MKRVLLALLALFGLALAQKPKVVVATGGVGGVYFYYGTTLAEIWNKAGVAEAQAIQTAASIDNLLLLENRTGGGTYYCATVLPDSATWPTPEGTSASRKSRPRASASSSPCTPTTSTW